MTRWYITRQKASTLVGRSLSQYLLAKQRGGVAVEFRGRPARLSHDGKQFYVETLPCRLVAHSAAK